MVEKITLAPTEVRGLGNIVSPKSLDDFLGLDSQISTEVNTVNGVSRDTFVVDGSASDLVETYLVVTGPTLVDVTDESFEFTVVMHKVSDDSVITSDVSLNCSVNGELYTADADTVTGEAVFTIMNTLEVGLYTVIFSYNTIDSNNRSFCFKNWSLLVNDISTGWDLDFYLNTGIVQEDDVCFLIARVTNGDGVPLHGQMVSFLEEYSYSVSSVRLEADVDVVEAGESAVLEVVLVDADGSRIPNQSVELWADLNDLYDPCTAPSSYWNNVPDIDVHSQYDENGWQVSAGMYSRIVLDKLISEPTFVEFTLVDYQGSSGYYSVIIYAYTNGDTTPSQGIIVGGDGSDSFTCLGQTINHALIKGGVYRIEYSSSTLSVYENGTLLATASNSVGATKFEFHTGTQRFIKIKDVRLGEIL